MPNPKCIRDLFPEISCCLRRVYKSYDPRATIMKTVVDDVFEITGKDPLLDVAVELERIARSDEFFIKRKLYPNVDFYSGMHLLLGFSGQSSCHTRHNLHVLSYLDFSDTHIDLPMIPNLHACSF